ncbi:SDR family oxidoreductase [Rhodovarius crocodyli]|uniref:NADP-dependent 3-hydroxy acid dehydrogenase YdfG n=1 Tax=Rhodovarius crocodyli TaxID=1979269 RepID=A0A437MM79_9PROT|nr:SDR family oxidoreductase [Rhodovarius crocodyli]RVT98729.1 SDR family oxidoreductase [Rhodovarius crocodyli]
MASNIGTAVVTGASTGIGALYAEGLAARGHDVILVARNAQRLEATAQRIRDRHGVAVRSIAADLGDAAQLHALETELAADPSITVLVNNAGMGAAGTLEQTDPARLDAIVALNVTALMRLTRALVPGMRARGKGRVVNIASVLAMAPEMVHGVYGATKAFVLAFSQSLRHEFAGSGLSVQVLMPGATATEFWGSAGIDVGNVPREMVMTVNDLVAAALIAFDREEFAVLPALQDAALWENYEGARQALIPNLSTSRIAPRYAA